MLRLVRLVPLLLLVSTTACDGVYMPFTADVTLSDTIRIRQAQPFADARSLSLRDLDDLVRQSEAENLEIDSVVVTTLSLYPTLLPSNEADSVLMTMIVEDPAGVRTTITQQEVFTEADLHLATVASSPLVTALTPSSHDPIDKLRRSLNGYLRKVGFADHLVGVSGSPIGGRFDADIAVKVQLRISYRKCVKTQVETLVDLALAECIS